MKLIKKLPAIPDTTRRVWGLVTAATAPNKNPATIMESIHVDGNNILISAARIKPNWGGILSAVGDLTDRPDTLVVMNGPHVAQIKGWAAGRLFCTAGHANDRERLIMTQDVLGVLENEDDARYAAFIVAGVTPLLGELEPTGDALWL